MLSSITNFLTDEEKIDSAIYWCGYFIIGWLLKGLAWLASKTSNTTDDSLVEQTQEIVKKSGERQKKKTK